MYGQIGSCLLKVRDLLKWLKRIFGKQSRHVTRSSRGIWVVICWRNVSINWLTILCSLSNRYCIIVCRVGGYLGFLIFCFERCFTTERWQMILFCWWQLIVCHVDFHSWDIFPYLRGWHRPIVLTILCFYPIIILL